MLSYTNWLLAVAGQIWKWYFPSVYTEISCKQFNQRLFPNLILLWLNNQRPKGLDNYLSSFELLLQDGFFSYDLNNSHFLAIFAVSYLNLEAIRKIALLKIANLDWITAIRAREIPLSNGGEKVNNSFKLLTVITNYLRGSVFKWVKSIQLISCSNFLSFKKSH